MDWCLLLTGARRSCWSTGDPQDCAEAALFLASPAAGFVTGQVLGIDGGRSLLDPLTIARG